MFLEGGSKKEYSTKEAFLNRLASRVSNVPPMEEMRCSPVSNHLGGQRVKNFETCLLLSRASKALLTSSPRFQRCVPELLATTLAGPCIVLWYGEKNRSK